MKLIYGLIIVTAVNNITKDKTRLKKEIGGLLMDRNYVIVCNRHKGIGNSTLLFWGSYTEDEAARRSFGGYTSDINMCEKYTLKEIEKEKFLIYGRDCNYDNFRKFDDFAIEIKRLKRLGRPMLVYYI